MCWLVFNNIMRCKFQVYTEDRTGISFFAFRSRENFTERNKKEYCSRKDV